MKNARQSAIFRLIERYDVGTQEELADLLREAGFSVTQATVSRDIRELRLLKVPNGMGGQKYALPMEGDYGLIDRFTRMFKESVISIAFAGNIVVIRTLSGSANVAAEAIDSLRLPQVLGTMAGDNTILVIVHNEDEAAQTAAHFQNMLK